jgi:hypothetical protein
MFSQEEPLTRLATYRGTAHEVVRGYSRGSLLDLLLPAVQEFQVEHHIGGDVGEIGVHHGRFYLALDTLRAPEERGIVADVFAQQELNVDRSGLGDRAAFEKNLLEISHDPDSVRIFEGDSLSLEFRRWLHDGRYAFRLFSVDGGHTVHHALNDLLLVDEYMCNGGAILLDDFCHPGFPGVTEALYKYLDRAPRFVPVCTMAGKLVLMSVGYASTFRKFLRAYAKNFDRFRIRSTWIGGAESLHVIPVEDRAELGSQDR